MGILFYNVYAVKNLLAFFLLKLQRKGRKTFEAQYF